MNHLLTSLTKKPMKINGDLNHLLNSSHKKPMKINGVIRIAPNKRKDIKTVFMIMSSSEPLEILIEYPLRLTRLGFKRFNLNVGYIVY